MALFRIISEDNIVGVIGIQDEREDIYNRSDVKLLMAMARQAGAMINGIELYAEKDRQLRETKQTLEQNRILSDDLKQMVRLGSELAFEKNIRRTRREKTILD